MLSIRTISTSWSQWHLHLFSNKRDYREKIFQEFRARWNVEMTMAVPFEQDERRIRAEMNPKAYGRSLQNTCSDRRNASPAYQSVPRKLYPLFIGVSSHLFFLRFPSSRSIFHSFARTRTHVFTANIPKKRLHVTTRRWIQKIRVRFFPSTATA